MQLITPTLYVMHILEYSMNSLKRDSEAAVVELRKVQLFNSKEPCKYVFVIGFGDILVIQNETSLYIYP